jgi:hypothetical protein
VPVLPSLQTAKQPHIDRICQPLRVCEENGPAAGVLGTPSHPSLAVKCHEVPPFNCPPFTSTRLSVLVLVPFSLFFASLVGDNHCDSFQALISASLLGGLETSLSR